MTQQKTPQLIAQDCIVVRVRRLSRVITKLYDNALRPLGIKASQLNILVVIGRRQLVRPAEVCRRLALDFSTLSRNVDRMRARGWIEFVEDEKDGRAHQLRLSAAGKQLLERAKPAWEKAQQQAKELLGEVGHAAVLTAAEAAKPNQ